MTKEDFLLECKDIGVDKITEIDNEHDEGFRVILKNGSSVYIIFRDEYGDSWMEYESEEHFIERWKNTHYLTPEETKKFYKRTMESIKDKYSNKNFNMFIKNLMND